MTAQRSQKPINHIQDDDKKKYSSDPAYKVVVNKNYAGDVDETGVNAGKVIANKLQAVDKEVNSHKDPEGWNEMLQEADAQIQRERVEKKKQDSIKNQLEIQTKAVLLEQQKASVFKNKVIGLLVGLICLVMMYFIIRWFVREVKKKSVSSTINWMKLTSRFKSLSQKEMLLLSVALGLIFSIITGSLFPKTKYYSLYKGQSVEVSKSISTFELQEFNFLLSIIMFLVSVGLLYGTWYFKNQNAKN